MWYVWLHSEHALACAGGIFPSCEGVFCVHVTHVSSGIGFSSRRMIACGFPPFLVLLTRRICPVRTFPSTWGGLRAIFRPSMFLCPPFPSGSKAHFAHCCGGIRLRAGVSPCASRQTSFQVARLGSCSDKGAWSVDTYGIAQAKHTLIGLVLIDLTRVSRISCGISGCPLILLLGARAMLFFGFLWDV